MTDDNTPVVETTENEDAKEEVTEVATPETDEVVATEQNDEDAVVNEEWTEEVKEETVEVKEETVEVKEETPEVAEEAKAE